MTVLVDEAMWPWRGERWAHLASDLDHDELHRFADALGLRRLSFQGDHYDVPAPMRARAIELGAQPVGGRELVRRLRAAGLRRPGGGARWDRDLAVAPPARLDGELLDAAARALARRLGPARTAAVVEPLRPLAGDRPALAELGLAVLHRPGEVALALDLVAADVPPGVAAGLGRGPGLDAGPEGQVPAPEGQVPGPAVGTARVRWPGAVWAYEAVLPLG